MKKLPCPHRLPEEKPNKPVIHTTGNATAEPVVEKESPLKEVASLSVEKKPISVPIKREEKKSASIRVEDAEEVGKTKTAVGPTSNIADQNVSNQSLPNTLEKSEELSRSDFSLGISTEEDSENQQIVSLPFESQEGSAFRKKSLEQEVEKMPVKRESDAGDAIGKEKQKAPSERKSNNGTSKSSPSVSTAFAEKNSPSSHIEPPQVQIPSKNVPPPFSTVQSKLSLEQRLVKAQLLIEQQSHAEAKEVLEPLFVDPPSTWEPWFWMGTAQLGLGNLGKAEEAFMEGLVRNDTVPYLWVQRAVIAQQRGHYGQAMDALRQAELLDPDLPEVQLNLAYNLEHQGNERLARRHYQQYLSLTEGNLTYHAVRRKVLERMLQMGSS